MQAAPLPLLSSARRAVFTILVLFVSVPLIHSPAMGDVYQIRPDGTGDFPTIQAGIDGCGGGDVLELADGTFTGPGNWDANYHGKSITIRSRSGHPEACVVDCAGAHRGFHFLSHESPMAKLEGVTVANGTGDGSAIFCGGGARPTIRDCIFRDGDGVAAWYQDQSTTPTLYRCQFLRNTTVQHGGAIYWFGPTTYYEGVIEGCLFEGNRAKEYAGAIYLSNLTRATVRRCVFRENHAGWGGGAAFTDGGAHLTLEDCLFLRNSCDLEPGGAVLIRQEGYMDVTRCTFVGNRAAVGDGSALAALWSYPSSVERCIFASNGAGKAITWTQFASLGIECTDIFGNSDGDWIGALDGRQLTNDNLHVDPLFCDPEADDYRVSQISPCDSTNSPVCGRIGAFGRGCEWDVLTVRPDGSGDHPTIQAAIDAAADGAVILLADGTFSGDGNHDIELRGKRIRIRSESDDPAACTIDCRGSGPEPHRGFWIHEGEGSGTVLEAVTIRGGYAESDGGAVLCEGASPLVRRCRLLENRAAGAGGGIACANEASPTVEDCDIAANQAAYQGGALDCGLLCQPRLARNTLVGNSAPDGSAVHFEGGEHEIAKTIAAWNTGGDAIGCAAGATVTLLCSDLYHNGGDWVGCIAGQGELNGNRSVDPIFCDAARYDLGLESHSPCAPQYVGDCWQIGSHTVECMSILVVRADGSGDYPTIDAAVSGALPGEIVQLEDGIYRGPGNRDVSFRGKAITVRSASGNPETCVIDCEGTPAHPHRGFDFITGEGNDSVIEGITIQGGHAWLDGSPSSQHGGAIRCLNGSDPTIRNCRFVENRAMSAGGAIFFQNTDGVKLFDCVFQKNQAADGGGAIAGENMHVEITRCTFLRNVSNAAGAIAIHSGGGNILIQGCTFLDNEATVGGGAIGTTDPWQDLLIENCTFHGNSGGSGGAIAAWENSPMVLRNNIITGSSGGSMFAGDDVTIECCDFWGNAGGDWMGTWGQLLGQYGNISEDPRYCGESEPAAPFGLNEDSPCAPDANPDCGLIGAWPVSCGVGGAPEDEGQVVRTAQIVSLSPAPFSQRTTISLEIPSGAGSRPVILELFDVGGRLVRTLVNGPLPSGRNRIDWDGKNAAGVDVVSGLYLLRLRAGSESATARVLRIR